MNNDNLVPALGTLWPLLSRKKELTGPYMN